MRLPKMILFDYGQTLVNERRFDGVAGTEAILKHATKNKYNRTATEVQAVAERINKLLPDNHFEFIIATSEYMFRKPNKRIFELALEKADLKPEEVWYVGDQIKADVEGAKNAGIFPVWYTGALDFYQDVTEVDTLTVHHFSELQNFCEKALTNE